MKKAVIDLDVFSTKLKELVMREHQLATEATIPSMESYHHMITTAVAMLGTAIIASCVIVE